MNNNNMYDALEYCLRALEDGADLNSVLSRFPKHADELRPILEAAIAARDVAVPPPSAEAMRRGRAKLLQRTAQLREAKAPAPRRAIPVFQRLSLALTIAMVLLLSGTGLVRASSTALPGEDLYPVKRTWEGMRLLFVFDTRLRESLESKFENERLKEVGELLSEGRHETIQFAGVVMQVDNLYYVSGIRVVILDSTLLPVQGLQNGAAVIITGRTNAEGFVEAESVEALPAGAIVPVGNPVEIESETESAESSGPSAGNGAGATSASDAVGSAQQSTSESEIQNFQTEGTVDAMSDQTLIVDGQTVYLLQPRVEGVITLGARVKVEGYFAPDGRFIATKIEVEESISDGSHENEDSGPNSNESHDDSAGGEDHPDDGGED